MLIYILLPIITFLSFFILGFFYLNKQELIRPYLYIIIPNLCIGFWALYFFFNSGKFGFGFYGDFPAFYLAGKQVLEDPANLYHIPCTLPYTYMPSFAISFSISLSLFPFNIAYVIFLLINFISGVISIIEFNKILRMMKVKKKIHRFMFLIIISNGYFVYLQFYFNQFKYLIFIILLFIVRREMQYRIQEKIKDLKYYLINYGLFVYAIGIAPYLIFLFIIYLFHEIKIKQLFYLNNIKKYFLVFVLFIAENFLFILYPNLIFDFIKWFSHPTQGRRLLRILFIKDMVNVDSKQMKVIIVISVIILIVSTLILLLKNNLNIEQKFSYFFLIYLFIGVYSFQILLGIIIFSFVLLLFVPYLNQDKNGIEFIKANKYLLIGLISIGFIFFLTDNFLFTLLFPIYFDYTNDFIDHPKILILHIIFLSSLSILYIKKRYFNSDFEEKTPFSYKKINFLNT